MKILLPMTKDRFRILEDIPNAIYDPNTRQTDGTLPAGSIISFEKIDITKYTKPDMTLKIGIRVVPNRMEYTMKKYGGRAAYGQTIYLPIEQVRKIEMEIVEGMP